MGNLYSYLPYTSIEEVEIHHLDFCYKKTIIYSRGRDEDPEAVYEWFNTIVCPLLEANAVIYRYTNETSEEANLNNIIDVYNSIKYKTENVILWGRGIGVHPTIHLAATHPEIGKVIIESSIRADYKLSEDHCVLCSSIAVDPGRLYGNDKNVSKIKVPMLIIHGKKDEVIGISHAEELVRDGDYFWFPEAGHADIREKWGKEMMNQIKKYISL